MDVETEAKDRLRRFAEEVFGSVAACAQAAGVSQPQFSLYVTGKRSPGYETLEKLSALGLSIDWLFTGRGSMLLGPDVMYQREEGEAGRVEESVTVKAGDQTFRFGWPGPADVPQDVLLFAATSLLRHAQAMEELARTKKKDEDEPSE